MTTSSVVEDSKNDDNNNNNNDDDNRTERVATAIARRKRKLPRSSKKTINSHNNNKKQKNNEAEKDDENEKESTDTTTNNNNVTKNGCKKSTEKNSANDDNNNDNDDDDNDDETTTTTRNKRRASRRQINKDDFTMDSNWNELSHTNKKRTGRNNNNNNNNDNKKKKEDSKNNNNNKNNKNNNTTNNKNTNNNEDSNTDFDMSWICVECKEAECVIDPSADQFLICEGACRRIFHYPCAGLAQLPEGDETWICNDCTRKRHACKLCQQYGIDGEDVFKCQKDSCGNFFHESCLSMQNLDYTVVLSTSSSKAAATAATTTTKEEKEENEEVPKTTTTTTTKTTDTANSISNTPNNDNATTTTMTTTTSTKEDNGESAVEPASPDTTASLPTTTLANNNTTSTTPPLVKATTSPPPTTTTAAPDCSQNTEDSEAAEEQQHVLTNLKFVCPAHWCWTCSQELPSEKLQEEAAAAAAERGKKPKRAAGKKRKKSNSSISHIFVCKKEPRLFQCLECPISYHASCIPPMARFHELALLCHEHSSICKLPDLEIENSYQKSYEEVIDKRLEKSFEDREKEAQRRKRKLQQHLDYDDDERSLNPFFVGMFGNRITQRETTIMDKLAGRTGRAGGSSASASERSLTDNITFCLPCDVQSEVHSKPPSYKHIHSLRYDPTNRPKRIRPTDEICNCTQRCDEACMNRVMMVECCGGDRSGDSNGKKRQNYYSNCRLGPNCGNRSLGERKSVKCKPQREKGRGWGLIAVEGARKGDLVQEYLGEIVDEETKDQRLDEWAKEHPNDPNFYLMSISNGWYIDARHFANLSRFINHSCDPNCILLRMNVDGYMRNGIFALRDIPPGEFLSYDYHFDTKHGDKFVCRCGATKCRGTMKGKNTNNNNSSNNNNQSNNDINNSATKKKLFEEAMAQFKRDKKFMQDFFERQSAKNSCVAVSVPGATNQEEAVANGVQDKYLAGARQNRIFLWRNAVQGSDFSRRALSLAKRKTGRNRATKKNTTVAVTQKKVDLISTIFARDNKEEG